MTLQELIDQLAAATDGAVEDSTWPRAVDKNFPEITSARLMYKKRTDLTITFSQIQVYIENIGTPEEAAYYPHGAVPRPVLESLDVPVPFLFTGAEIKAAVNKGGFKIVNKRNEDDHMVVDGYIDDAVDSTLVKLTSWYVFKQGQNILAKRIG